MCYCYIIKSISAPSDQGNAYAALEQSIKNLDCKYLDLYLIHWPGKHSFRVVSVLYNFFYYTGASGIRSNDSKNAELRKLSWLQLVKAREDGLVHDIGVSNYTIRHLRELFTYNSGVKPSVNQIEWHPHYYDSELKNFCRREGILLQAYSSLGGTNNSRLISDSNVVAIAKKLNKTPAQVLLRWALQQNIAIIPKARSKQHIEDNIDLDFTIPEVDMNVLYNLKTHEKYAWDPVVIA